MSRADEQIAPLSERRKTLVSNAVPAMTAVALSLVTQWKSVMTPDEAQAIARAALVDSAARYDPAHGVELTTYATFCVRGAILNAIRRERRERAPVAILNAHLAANNYLAEQSGAPESSPALWASARRRSEAFGAKMAAAVVASMVAGVLNYDDGTEEAIARRQAFQRAINAVQSARAVIDVRERELLDLHYGKELSLRDVAERMNISYATTKRIHDSMLEHLAAILQRQGIQTIDDTGVTG